MRKLLVLASCLVLILGLVGEASAAVIEWVGTGTTKLGAGRPAKQTGAGVATINGSGGGIHITTLRMGGGIGGTNTAPATDPDVTGTVKTIITALTIGSGTFAPVSGGGDLTQNTLPIVGTGKICVFFTGCGNFIPLPLQQGSNGVGIGGLITAGGAGPLRVSLLNNPWTLGTGAQINQTDNAGFTTKTIAGFVHDPSSGTSSTAQASGVVQLITPVQVVTIGFPGQVEKLSLFGTIRLHFTPEPGLMLLLGSGVVGLALLGRSRFKK